MRSRGKGHRLGGKLKRRNKKSGSTDGTEPWCPKTVTASITGPGSCR